MMKSSVSLIVGADSADEVGRQLAVYAERFATQSWFAGDRPQERAKAAPDLMIVGLADALSGGLRGVYGLPELSVPPECVHAYPYPLGSKMDATGLYSPDGQGIRVGGSIGEYHLFSTVMHEMIHFKSANWAAMVGSGAGRSARSFRVGLSEEPVAGKIFFDGLNEAVTETATLIMSSSVRGFPAFRAELAAANRYSEMSGYHVDEIMCAVPAVSRSFAMLAGYQDERAGLRLLVDGLVGRGRASFSQQAEKVGEFIGAMMTGNIRPLAELVDRRFGAGTYGRLGTAGKGKSLLNIVRSL